MKVKKEDWNYAAGVATGMSKFSNKAPKLKKKHKFKADVATLSGPMRPYYEETERILEILQEEIKKEKRKIKNKIYEIASEFGDTTGGDRSSAQVAEDDLGADYSGKNNPTE